MLSPLPPLAVYHSLPELLTGQMSAIVTTTTKVRHLGDLGNTLVLLLPIFNQPPIPYSLSLRVSK